MEEEANDKVDDVVPRLIRKISDVEFAVRPLMKLESFSSSDIYARWGWNERFKKCRNLSSLTEEDILFKAKAFTELFIDFNHMASLFGKIIISEIYLPNPKKTIKMIDKGGIAGGSKFLHAGKVLYVCTSFTVLLLI
jgi:hypothetical protein